MKLICAFVFDYVDSWFSHEVLILGSIFLSVCFVLLYHGKQFFSHATMRQMLPKRYYQYYGQLVIGN